MGARSVGVFAGGGRVALDKPTLSHTNTGQFTIGNYNASYLYSASVTAGTATVAGSVLTMSNANSVATLYATYGKATSTSILAERKSITYNQPVNNPYPCGTHQCNCTTGWGSCGCGTCGGYPAPNAQSWGQCGCPGDMCWYNSTTTCSTCTSYCDSWSNTGEDPVPSGYAKTYGEWRKIT
jgi:hypothetical protein